MLLRSDDKPYMNPYLAGVLLGVVLFLAYLLTGHGLGASGGLRSVVASGADAVAPSTVNSSGYLAKFSRSPRSIMGNWVFWVIVGSVAGALVSGLLARRVRPEVYKGPRISVAVRLLMAFVGGLFMGYGSQWARGCTSGQALSGGATLAAGSWAFMFSVFGGAYLLAWPLRRLWK